MNPDPEPQLEYLGGRREVAGHLLELGNRIPVSVVAEPDWEVLHGYLQVPLDPMAPEIEPLLVDVAEDVCDARWNRRSVFVQYAAGGQLYSFRSVVRGVGRSGLRLDSPSEICLRGAPSKAGMAVAGTSEDGPGFRLVGMVPTEGAAATRLIAGGALHAQVVQRAAKVNNLRKVDEAIRDLSLQSSVALTVDGTSILHRCGSPASACATAIAASASRPRGRSPARCD